MTQPLNFTTKAISDLMDMARISPNDARKCGLRFVADLLQRAEVFVLPDKGELFDRSKPYPELPASVFRPPFPVVALEYQAVGDCIEGSIYSAVRCSKRISLAWEWDGRTPLGGAPDPEAPKPGEAVAMASLLYVDQVGKWVPVVAAVITDYDAGYVEPGNRDLQDALIREGRVTAKQASARKLDIQHILPLMPDAMAELMLSEGVTQGLNCICADLMDEVNAYRDMCLALSCNNVSVHKHAQSAKLNKSRIRMGRPPLRDFHVLEIAGASDGDGFGAAQGGSRSHLRRGHIRRLGSERITWVNATMVRGSRPGFVEKHYAMKEASNGA